VKALSTGIALQLRWIQPSTFELHFVLYSENNLLGELRIEPDWTANGTLTIPSFETERWTFSQKGF